MPKTCGNYGELESQNNIRADTSHSARDKYKRSSYSKSVERPRRHHSADIKAPWKSRTPVERFPAQEVKRLRELHKNAKHSAAGLPPRRFSESTLQDVAQSSQSSFVVLKSRISGSLSTLVPKNRIKQKLRTNEYSRTNSIGSSHFSKDTRHLYVSGNTSHEPSRPLKRWSQIPAGLLVDNANSDKRPRSNKSEHRRSQHTTEESQKIRRKSVEHELGKTKKYAVEQDEVKKAEKEDGRKKSSTGTTLFPRQFEEKEVKQAEVVGKRKSHQEMVPRNSKEYKERREMMESHKPSNENIERESEHRKHRRSKKLEPPETPEQVGRNHVISKETSPKIDITDEETLKANPQKKDRTHKSETIKDKHRHRDMSFEEAQHSSEKGDVTSKKKHHRSHHSRSESRGKSSHHRESRRSGSHSHHHSSKRSENHRDSKQSSSRERKSYADDASDRHSRKSTHRHSYGKKHRSRSEDNTNSDKDATDRRSRRDNSYRRCVEKCRHKYKSNTKSKRTSDGSQSSGDSVSSYEDERRHPSRASRHRESSRCSKVDSELMDVLSEMCSEIENRLCDDTVSGYRDRRSRHTDRSSFGRYLSPDTLAILEESDRPRRLSADYRPRRAGNGYLTGLPPRAPRHQYSDNESKPRPCTCTPVTSNHLQQSPVVHKGPVYYTSSQPIPVPIASPQPPPTAWCPNPVASPMPNVIPYRPSPVAVMAPQPMTAIPTMCNPVMAAPPTIQSGLVYPTYAYCQRI